MSDIPDISLEEGRSDGVVAEVVVYVGEQETAVPLVRHVAAVVDPGDQVLERVPRRVLVLVQVDAQQVLRDLRGEARGAVSEEAGGI